MLPTLFEIPAPPAWAAVVIIAVLVALAVLIELREQRREGMEPRPLHLAGVAAIAAILGLLAILALHRWGPVPVRAWGTMLMLGFTAAMLWAIYDARRNEHFDTSYIVDVTLAILVGAIIGSRVLSVILNWDHYSVHPEQLVRVWAGGLSFHGGLIGGIIAGGALTRLRGKSILRAMDLFAPSIAIGYAITRIGCFLNGCCHGHPTDSVFGVVFPHIANAGPVGVQIHPTQLYSSFAALVIFGILVTVRRYLAHPGQLFGCYLVLYSLGRFVVEEFRRGASGAVSATFPPLTIAQVASIAIALVVAGLMWWNHLRGTRNARTP